MNYLQKVTLYIKENLLRRTPNLKSEEPPEEMSKFDGYLNLFCKVLSWDDPTLTWITFIIVNFLFASIIYYETKFYCVLLTTVALLVCLDYYGDGIDFRKMRRYMYFKDITDSCSSFLHSMHAWKRENPSYFCGAMTTFFLTLSFIGRAISGRVLAYFLLLAIYFGPTVFKLAPKQMRDVCWQFINAFRTTDIVGETDLIPAVNGDFDDVDENNDGDSMKTERTQDSMTSFISGISMMPSHLDDGTDLEDDDLVPMNSSRLQRDEMSSDSDEDHQIMYFDSGNFKRSSSTSSDEEQFSRGMKFTDSVDASPANADRLSKLGAGVVSSLAAAGSSLLSSIQANFAKQDDAPAKRSDSSDSDFEIINSDEADDTIRHE